MAVVIKYYINGVLQPYSPPVPTGTLVASVTPSIGHADVVSRHIGDLVVRTDVKVP